MTAGASWTAQLAAALIAAAFGVAASPLTLLYKVSARPVTRIAADFVATVGIALLFLLSAETGAEGRLTLYCAACYLVALAFAGKGVTRAAKTVWNGVKEKCPRLAKFCTRGLNAGTKIESGDEATAGGTLPAADDCGIADARAFRKRGGTPTPSSSRYNRRRAGRHSAVSPREKGAR